MLEMQSNLRVPGTIVGVFASLLALAGWLAGWLAGCLLAAGKFTEQVPHTVHVRYLGCRKRDRSKSHL